MTSYVEKIIAKDEQELSLVDIQRLMAAGVMNPLTADQDMAQFMADGGTATALIADKIMKPNDRLSAAERLAIYNRQYWFRLLDCLYDDFPGLRAITGEEKFYDLSVAYLRKYPSTSYSLRDLSANMEQFLLESPEWTGKYAKAMLDMARFEWAQVVAFDGPELPKMDPQAIAKTPADKLYFKLQPYITLLELNYPFDDFVLALKKEEHRRSEASAEWSRSDTKTKKAKLPKLSKTYLAVHRFQNSLYYKRLEPAAFYMLTALREGKSLAQACEVAQENFRPKSKAAAELPQKIHEWFANWNNLGWFC